MLLGATENVLGIFGFDRTLFGKSKDKQWWMTTRRDRINDVQAEAGAGLPSELNHDRIKN